MTDSPDYQVVIAGGGMVGISLALALVHHSPACRVLLIESFPLPAADGDFAAGYSPSFDARSTALSYGSCLIYQQLGLWEAMREQAQPISTIHVSEKGRFGSTRLRAQDYQWPALGYVVENAWLGSSLIQALHRGNVATLSPASVMGAAMTESGMRLTLDSGDNLRAELLVVADGANSGLRDALGIGSTERPYGRHALIANIGHRQDHEGCAFERFTEHGPLAMLPLVPAGSKNRSALVWSLPPGDAEIQCAADPTEFLRRLQNEFGYRLGRLEQVGERHCYPLALVEAREQVRSGVVVMGNAAHALHPVAGQGFNLALRDVARLAAELALAMRQGDSPGALPVLQAYQKNQADDQRKTTLFSDRLPALFESRDRALGLLRDLGLFALDLAPALKRQFVQQTAGMAASAEYRDVRP